MGAMTVRGRVVGRDGETSRLAAHVDALAAGTGGVLVVAGPAGIGKTALTGRLRELATDAGARVVTGRSYRFPSGLAYAPLVDALAATVRADAPDGDLVRDLTSLGQLFDGLPASDAPTDPLLGRTRLATALVTLVHRLADRSPTVIVLDDVQWADEATFELLPLLAADLDTVPVLLVLVTRTRAPDPGEQRIVQVADRLASHRIDLGPLDRTAVEQMVRVALDDGTFPAELVDVVLERTGGTPLFVEELVASMIRDGRLGRVGRAWRFDATDLPAPASGYELMSARLADCTDDELAILLPLALHGEPVAERTLIGLGVDSTLLRPLSTRGLVAEQPIVGGRGWAVAHPVLADVLAERVGADDRAGWHERLARAFADDADRFADHLLHAGESAVRVVGSTADLADVFVQAAARAERQGSLIAATQYLTAAADLLRSPTADPRHAEATRRLARVWSARGHHDIAEPLGHEALGEFLELDDCAGSLTAAEVLGEIGFYLGRREFGWLDPVVDLALASGDDELALRAHYRRYFEQARRFGVEPGQAEFFAVAERIAASGGDGPLTRFARSITTMDRIGHPPRDITIATPLRDAAREVDDDPWFALRCWNLYLDMELVRGDWPAVAETVAEMTEFTRRHDQLENWRVRVAEAQHLHFVGRVQAGREVEVFYRGLVSSNLRVRAIVVLLHTLCDAALGDGEMLRDDLAQARDLAPRIDGDDRHSVDALRSIFLLAGVALGDGDLVASTELPSPTLMTGTPVLPALARLRTACFLGDRQVLDDTTGPLRELDPTGEHLAGLLADLADGLFSVEHGDRADVAALRRAADGFGRLGMPVFAAEATDALHRAGAVDNDALALALDGLGDDVDGGTVAAAIVDRLGRGAPAGTTGTDVLSRREREVAELVMDGLTNREVADRLFISIRTVTSHLDHIYTKLGIGSRQELTARLRP